MSIQRLNKFKSSALTLPLVMVLSAPVLAQNSWSDVAAGSQLDPKIALPLGSPAAPQGSLVFYNDRAVFTATGATLVTENFGGSLVAPNDVCADVPALNSLTNDACFATGGVVAGQELDVNINGGGGNYVLLTTGFLGTTTEVVGPSSFADNAVFRFNPPVTAVGFDVVGDLLSTVDINIEIFDDGGNSLGTTSAAGTNPGTFFGVTSTTPIGRIETVEPDGDGELFSGLVFGNVNLGPPQIIPTLNQWALLLLGLILASSAVVAIRR